MGRHHEGVHAEIDRFHYVRIRKNGLTYTYSVWRRISTLSNKVLFSCACRAASRHGAIEHARRELEARKAGDK